MATRRLAPGQNHRTLLINPPYAYSEVPIMPMGLSYIAGTLEHHGYQVELLDLLVSRYSRDKIHKKMNEYQPDIVGVTSVTMNYPLASDILKYCKSLDPDVVTVIGGPHVTFSCAETLESAAWIDIIVRGEGELTILDIVQGKERENIPGIAYRNNGTVAMTEPRPLIEDLDHVPLPARHLFPLSRYHALDVHASVITGRGCPFNCIFCVGSKMGGRRARYRDPKLIIDEVEQAMGFGFREVNFEDDLVTLNHRHMYGICDEIIGRGLKFNWSAFSRADTVNPELLRRMKEAGCTWLLYGVESGNQEILDTIKKKISLEKIRDGVKMARDAGIEIFASFVLGLPGESKETMERSANFAMDLGCFFGFHVLSPFPGTEIRENAEDYGIEILTSDWSKYDCNRPVTRTLQAGPDEITKLLHGWYRALKLPAPGSDPAADASRNSKRRSLLAAALLKNDIIESLGPMALSDNPSAGLAEKVSGLVPYPLNEVQESVKAWTAAGLLEHHINDQRISWKWR